MNGHRLRGVAAQICDAALAPDLWPAVLDSVTDAFGAVGAAYIVRDKRTGAVDWINLSGPSAEMRGDYVAHYAALDPYSPLLGARTDGHWQRLSACLPETVLRTDEWYNDFILKSRVADIVGTQLLDNPSRTAFFGIHAGIGSTSFMNTDATSLQELFEPLSKAARLHDELRRAGWKSAIAVQTLDQLAVAAIVTDAAGRVIEMNPAAEQIMLLDDGLTLRNSRLGAERVFEAVKLARLITAAATGEKSGATAGRMLVGRSGGKSPLTLSVAPLGTRQIAIEGRFALILVASAENHASSAGEWAELFGLTPAECRLAAGLMDGKRLSDMAAPHGVRISTLRTQLSSILRKAGVTRQTDLVRVLSNIRVISRLRPEPGEAG